MPCPVHYTTQSPLLNWDLRAPPPHTLGSHSPPPAGFSALLRLLHAPPRALGVGRPLAALDVEWSGLGVASTAERLEFGTRLGVGGSSDTFACRGGEAVAKVARVATKTVAADFAAERDALVDLRGVATATGLVLELVAVGQRAGAGSSALAAGQRAGRAATPWPVLLLRPRGEALDEWVRARVETAADGAAARVAAADAVARRVLDALAAAHALEWIHCDVRPANIVVVADGHAMLIDWGLATRAGQRLEPRSVAAYSDTRLFVGGGAPTATASTDALATLFHVMRRRFWGRLRRAVGVRRERQHGRCGRCRRARLVAAPAAGGR